MISNRVFAFSAEKQLFEQNIKHLGAYRARKVTATLQQIYPSGIPEHDPPSVVNAPTQTDALRTTRLN
jgi:hypothetical protein